MGLPWGGVSSDRKVQGFQWSIEVVGVRPWPGCEWPPTGRRQSGPPQGLGESLRDHFIEARSNRGVGVHPPIQRVQ